MAESPKPPSMSQTLLNGVGGVWTNIIMSYLSSSIAATISLLELGK